MNKTDRIIEAATKAASEITDLWWTRPEQNGHIKAQIVRDIITRHLVGVPPGPITNPLSRIETLELNRPEDVIKRIKERRESLRQLYPEWTKVIDSVLHDEDFAGITP